MIPFIEFSLMLLFACFLPFILSSYRPPEILRAMTMGMNFTSHLQDRIVVHGTDFYSRRAINGNPANLNPAKTCDSPFLSMAHGSNKAVISYPGHNDVTVEF